MNYLLGPYDPYPLSLSSKQKLKWLNWIKKEKKLSLGKWKITLIIVDPSSIWVNVNRCF